MERRESSAHVRILLHCWRVKHKLKTSSGNQRGSTIGMPINLNPVARRRTRCREVRAMMSGYLDGDLGPSAVRKVNRHLRWCPSCRRMLTNLRRTIDGLHALANTCAADDCSDVRPAQP